jgi:UDP-N-acetylmuramoylalanine--D-glutamate ligase
MFKTNSSDFDKKVQLIEKFLSSSGIKIIIWGFGVTGRSLLSFCHKHLARNNTYIIFDKNYNEEVVIDGILYTNKFAVLADDTVDCILPSPGIKLDKNALYYTKIIPEFDIFFYFKRKKHYQSIIITGSVGKTSIATMVHFYLQNHFAHVVLAGNIGYPLLDVLEDSREDTFFIIEASSAQLEHTELVAPEYFVITNLYANHLDMHDNFYGYGIAKLKPLCSISSIKKIFLDTTVLDFIISLDLNLSLSESQKIVCIEENQSVECVKKDDHQYLYKNFIIAHEFDFPAFSYAKNWLLVSCIRFFITGLIIDFKSEGAPCLPAYRLERIFESNAIVIYNDSKSTVIESTMAAIEEIQAMHPQHKIYCIVGGLSKGVDRQGSISKISSMVDRVYCFGGEAGLYAGINYRFSSLEDIVVRVAREVEHGEREQDQIVLLFSPGGSSFDLYKSYIHRGEEFNNLITKYFEFRNTDMFDFVKVVDRALP